MGDERMTVICEEDGNRYTYRFENIRIPACKVYCRSISTFFRLALYPWASFWRNGGPRARSRLQDARQLASVPISMNLHNIKRYMAMYLKLYPHSSYFCRCTRMALNHVKLFSQVHLFLCMLPPRSARPIRGLLHAMFFWKHQGSVAYIFTSSKSHLLCTAVTWCL